MSTPSFSASSSASRPASWAPGTRPGAEEVDVGLGHLAGGEGELLGVGEESAGGLVEGGCAPVGLDGLDEGGIVDLMGQHRSRDAAAGDRGLQ